MYSLGRHHSHPAPSRQCDDIRNRSTNPLRWKSMEIPNTFTRPLLTERRFRFLSDFENMSVVASETDPQSDSVPAISAHCCAEPGDVACHICTGEKIKAVKSCLTCSVSYCETHVRNHYIEEAFNQHELVDATNDLKQKIYQQDKVTLNSSPIEELILPKKKIKAKDQDGQRNSIGTAEKYQKERKWNHRLLLSARIPWLSTDSESSSSMKSEESVEPPPIFPRNSSTKPLGGQLFKSMEKRKTFKRSPIVVSLPDYIHGFSSDEDEDLRNSLPATSHKTLFDIHGEVTEDAQRGTDSESPSSMKSEESVEPPPIFPRNVSNSLSELFLDDEPLRVTPFTFSRNKSNYSSGKSLNSDNSMDAPLGFSGNKSNFSDKSMERPVTLRRNKFNSSSGRSLNYRKSMELQSPTFSRNKSNYSSGISSNSDNSMGAPIRFSRNVSNSPSEWFLDDELFKVTPVTFSRNKSNYSSGISSNSDNSMGAPIRFSSVVASETDPQSDSVPAISAHCCAEPGDVACHICTGEKIKAVKSCLTCSVSYCETHVRNHYTEEAFNQHELVDATNDLKQKIYQQDKVTLNSSPIEELILPKKKIKAMDQDGKRRSLRIKELLGSIGKKHNGAHRVSNGRKME